MFIIDFFHKMCRGYTDKELEDEKSSVLALRSLMENLEIKFEGEDDLFYVGETSYFDLVEEKEKRIATIFCSYFLKLYVYLLKTYGAEWLGLENVDFDVFSRQSFVQGYSEILVNAFRQESTLTEIIKECMELAELTTLPRSENPVNVPDLSETPVYTVPEKPRREPDILSSDSSQAPNPKTRGEVNKKNSRKKRKRK